MLLLIPLWIHKALPVPFLPIGFCVLLAGLGLLLRRRWITAIALLLLWGFSIQPTATFLASGLEGRYPAMEVKDCPQADAVVVLSGVLMEPVTSATEWNQAVDRFERGVELIVNERAPVLLFTRGVSSPVVGRESDGEQLSREALKHGIPPEKIALTEDLVYETSAEIRSIRKTMDKRGWRRIILVTSATHMSRAMLLAREAKMDAIPFPADFEAERRRPIEFQSFLPQARYLDRSERVIREWIGLTYYRVFGV